ncbi:hypothetical protein Q5P01_008375 [Channa striata]|uniref:Uncharacterized protein n=1 Tax=Channa striata TaxID=64152 RepID=A0AA88SUP0_CHASR|nr:hypothetical protein Q5P01_008375 [Channa striata]
MKPLDTVLMTRRHGEGKSRVFSPAGRPRPGVTFALGENRPPGATESRRVLQREEPEEWLQFTLRALPVTSSLYSEITLFSGDRKDHIQNHRPLQEKADGVSRRGGTMLTPLDPQKLSAAISKGVSDAGSEEPLPYLFSDYLDQVSLGN